MFSITSNDFVGLLRNLSLTLVNYEQTLYIYQHFTVAEDEDSTRCKHQLTLDDFHEILVLANINYDQTLHISDGFTVTEDENSTRCTESMVSGPSTDYGWFLQNSVAHSSLRSTFTYMCVYPRFTVYIRIAQLQYFLVIQLTLEDEIRLSAKVNYYQNLDIYQSFTVAEDEESMRYELILVRSNDKRP